MTAEPFKLIRNTLCWFQPSFFGDSWKIESENLIPPRSTDCDTGYVVKDPFGSSSVSRPGPLTDIVHIFEEVVIKR